MFINEYSLDLSALGYVRGHRGYISVRTADDSLLKRAMRTAQYNRVIFHRIGDVLDTPRDDLGNMALVTNAVLLSL